MRYAKRYRFVIMLFLLSLLCGGVIVRGTSEPFLTTYAGMLSHAILRYAFMMLVLFADYLFYTSMHVTGYIMRKKSFLQCETSLFCKESVLVAILCIVMQVPALLWKGELYVQNLYMMFALLVTVYVHALFIIAIIKVVNAFVEKRSTACIVTFVLYGVIDIFFMALVSMGVIPDMIQLSVLFVLPVVMDNWWLPIAVQVLLTMFLSISALQYRCEHMGYMPGDEHEET